MFEDYKKRMRQANAQESDRATLERNRLGDLLREDGPTARNQEDRTTEEQKDRQKYNEYLRKELVNIKNLVLKNPLQRTKQENEFLILFLKHEFEVFQDIEKPCLEMFIQRLSFNVFKPGETVAKAGQPCTSMIMFIDGEVEALEKLP